MKDLSNKNVIHIKKEGVEYLQFRRLLEYSDIINHAYSVGIDKDYRTERAGNVALSKEELKNTENNYKLLTSAINSKYENIIKARQNHTKQVKCVEEKEEGVQFYSEEYKETYALVTNKTNIMLSTSNADCILLFSDLKRFDVFPIDVWVRRVMNDLYIKKSDESKVSKAKIEKLAEEKFGDLKGLAQQYLFYWRREN